MAFKNKQICNPVTKQDIRFILTSKDTNGALLEMEVTYHAQSKEPATHYHPFQAEYFSVLQGQLTLRVDGQLQILNKGETFHIPFNKEHSMWNGTAEKTVVNWKVVPAMATENFLEMATGLAIDGKTNKKGMPDFLQVILMANKYANEFRLSKPSFAVQKIMFVILIPFSYLFGYKASYKKYLD